MLLTEVGLSTAAAIAASTAGTASTASTATRKGKPKGFTKFLDSNRLRFLFRNIKDLNEVPTSNQGSTGGVTIKKASSSEEDFNSRGIIKSGHGMDV